MTKQMDIEQLQAEHFDQLASLYSSHYGDKWSLQYRDDFINAALFDDIDLKGAQVLDAMCGSGEMTGFLLSRRAEVTAVDISAKEIAQLESRFANFSQHCQAKCASILNTGLENDQFDCAVVVGGFHHLHPNVEDAISEIHRILKPGGKLVFVEPHKGSFADMFRTLWYRFDKYFADNEAAIDIKYLKQQFAQQFSFKKEVYRGNLAYLLVVNSMIFRIPLWLKRYYSRPLFWIERLIAKIQTQKSSCFVICQWVKK